MKLIENIEKIMKIKGISAYQIEKDIGIRQTTFQGWKRGSEPSADKIIKLLQYLEVSPNELFGYSDIINLTDNEKEMLNLFKQLPEREQIKFIARLEDKIDESKRTAEE